MRFITSTIKHLFDFILDIFKSLNPLSWSLFSKEIPVIDKIGSGVIGLGVLTFIQTKPNLEDVPTINEVINFSVGVLGNNWKQIALTLVVVFSDYLIGWIRFRYFEKYENNKTKWNYDEASKGFVRKVAILTAFLISLYGNAIMFESNSYISNGITLIVFMNEISSIEGHLHYGFGVEFPMRKLFSKVLPEWFTISQSQEDSQ